MRSSYQILYRTCGVVLFNSFNNDEYYTIPNLPLGGARLACAGFIDTPECLSAYNELKQRFNVVYQSSPRRNRNSGRQFFFVVYDGIRRNGK